MSKKNELSTVSSIPVLRTIDSYIQWKSAMRAHLQSIGTDDIVLGVEPRPPRVFLNSRETHRTTPLPEEEREMDEEADQPDRDPIFAKHSESMTPGPDAVYVNEPAVFSEARRVYRDWVAKDKQARGDMSLTLSLALRSDVENITSSAELWTALEEMHDVQQPEFQQETRIKLALISLAPGADVMKHIETFNSLITTAKIVGLEYCDRCILFNRDRD